MTVQLEQYNGQEVDDFLAHYGVLGMKWGKTRAKAKAADIHQARRNVESDNRNLTRKEDKVRRLKTGTAARAKGETELAKMRSDMLKNPDRVVAARMTRGEKAISLLLVNALAPGVGTIAVIGTSAHSRRIERKQELGKYNVKKK